MKIDALVVTRAPLNTLGAVAQQLAPLSAAELQELGARVFKESMGKSVGALSDNAGKIDQLGRMLPSPQAQALARGFAGDTTIAPQELRALDRIAMSFDQRKDGVVVVVARPGQHHLSNSTRDLLRGAFKGKAVEFVHEHGAVVHAQGGARAPKALTATRKAEVKAAFDARFDGVRDVSVKGGVVRITVGNAFDDTLGGASKRLVKKLFGDVPFSVVRDTKGDKPLMEIDEHGVAAAWAGGVARVPMYTHDQSVQARASLRDDRVQSVYTDVRGRSLFVIVAPWVDPKNARSIAKKVSAELKADSIEVFMASGTAFIYGQAEGAKPFQLDAAELSAAENALRRIDPHVSGVSLCTFRDDGSWSSRFHGSHGAETGNGVAIIVDQKADLSTSDALEQKLRKQLRLPKSALVTIERDTLSGSTHLASMGVPKQKDTYAGLRDGDG
jgi:hypothetical protein